MNRREIIKALGLGGFGAIAPSRASEAIEGEVIPKAESFQFTIRAYRRGKLVHERPCNLMRTERKRKIYYGVGEAVTVIEGHKKPLEVDELRIVMNAYGIEVAIPENPLDPPPYYVGVKNTLTIEGGIDGLLSVET